MNRLLLLAWLGLVFFSSAIPGGVNIWTTSGPFGANASVVLVDPQTPNVIYAGTEGGSVFKMTLQARVSGRPTIDNPRSPLRVSPNPCRDVANVSLASSLLSPHSSLSIYDASGRLVRTLAVGTSSIALRTSDMEPGAYFIRVRSGRETRTSRLTIAD